MPNALLERRAVVKRFVEGETRSQGALLPEHLDDYVAQDNPVRVVDAFVEHLDLRKLGFERVDRSFNGRPAYHPDVLLKIYIYGYLNRIQSSRRLERESARNLELIWLTGRLYLDFKTIARFRQDNGQPIRNVCAQFVGVCRSLKLFSNALVAIDGSKFKAVNNRDRNFTADKIDRRREQIEASIERYLSAIRLREKIACLKEQMTRLDQIEAQLQQTPDKQLSLTDPDARSMATSGRGTGIVGHDRTQLANMAKQAAYSDRS